MKPGARNCTTAGATMMASFCETLPGMHSLSGLAVSCTKKKNPKKNQPATETCESSNGKNAIRNDKESEWIWLCF